MFNKMNQRIKNLTVIDIGLVKWAVFFTTIILIKLFPQLLKINYSVLIVLLIIFSLKPFYKFWLKK
jgi:hypothetical protein